MGYEKFVRRVTPYTPGEQPKGRVIKLNTNESPYPPSPMVDKALKEMDTDFLRKYPEVDSDMLITALAKYYGIGKEKIFAGIGSDDVLSLCFLTFFNGPDPVIFPEITYSFYDVWAEVYGIPYETVPLKEDLSLDPDGFKGRKTGGIVIANPNAPTGIAEDLSAIEGIISENPDIMVIVDEAYIDFGGETALPLLQKYENLLITRTMSKSRALAGMRIGYAFGNEKAIKYLNDIKYSINSYTLNTPALLAGKAAIEDDAYFKEIRDRIIRTRERTKKELRNLGFKVCDSKTNFVFASHDGVLEGETSSGFALRTYETLKEKGIFVRYFKKPGIDQYLRITIGTDEEMDALFSELRKIV